MDQKARIIDKANNLGLNAGEDLSNVAESLNIKDFDEDNSSKLNELENALDNEIQNKNREEIVNTYDNGEVSQPIENLYDDSYNDSNEANVRPAFGEQEYNNARDENGNFDKNYYKNKEDELKQKVEDAQKEKDNEYKDVSKDKDKEDKDNSSNQNNKDNNENKNGENNKDNKENENKDNANNKDDKENKSKDSANDKDSKDESKKENDNDKQQSKKNNGNENNQNQQLKKKNTLDKAKDNANLAKAKMDMASNKLNNAKAKAYQLTHPGEALKDGAKNLAKKGAQAAKEGAKKGASVVGKAIVAFIKANPWILGILAVLIFLLIMMMALTGDDEGTKSNTLTCEGMSFNATSFTRAEFIDKVTEYYTAKNASYSQEFIDHAGDIFDIASSNNINPEIVIIRADREGYSPSGYKESLSNYHNYWGINCNNTGDLKDCENFIDFNEGLTKFIDIIKDKTSLTDMMSSYSSLGSYWYNPGGSGMGGCYYLPYIREYLMPDRKEIVEDACSIGNYCYKNGTGSCVETSELDRLAYTKYQVNKMVEDRERIFGIPADECHNFAEGCTIYGQSDERWADIRLGNSNATMGGQGCAVTSLAIGISCSGVPVTIEDFDAGKFVEALNNGDCFDRSGQINWKCKAISEVAPSVSYYTTEIVVGMDLFNIKYKVLSYDPDETFIILHYNHEDRDGGHFVVYSLAKNNDFIVKDPANGGVQSTVRISKIDRFVVFKINKGD